MTICIHCKRRFADFSSDDFVLDLPSPPGKGITARSNAAHERRMKVYWNNEEGDCGCNSQLERGDVE